MNRTIVSLRLMSQTRTPDEFFAALGVAADITWQKGEHRVRTSIVRQDHGYEFSAGPGDGITLEEQTDGLLKRLDPIAGAIRELNCDCVQLTCVVYADRPPAINFSSTALEKLCRLGASLDIDLYVADGNWSE